MRLYVLLSLATVLTAQDQKPFRLPVPRMWSDAAMADLELPLAQAEHSLRRGCPFFR
jgi:hypothetical protein